MKRFLTVLTLASALLLVAVSCDRSDAIRAIPDDTVIAIKIHPGTLLSQSGIQGNKDFDKMLREISDKGRYSFVKKIIEDPSSATGVNIDQEIVFASNLDDSYIIIPLSSSKRFVQFVKKTRGDINTASGRRKGYSHYFGHDEQYCEGIIADHVAIISTDSSKPASELAELISEGCSIDEPSFLDFCSADEAVALWFSFPALTDMAGSHVRGNEAMALAMLGDSYILATADPGRGGGDIYVKFYMDEHLSENSGSVTKLVSLGSTRYFKYMPPEPMLVINAGTGNFRDIYESIPAFTVKSLELDGFLAKSGITKDDLKGIGGPFTLAGSVSGIGRRATPSFAFALACKEEFVKKLAIKAELPRKGDAWLIPAGDPDLYMFAEDGALIVMTEDLYMMSKGGVLPKNLGDDQVRHHVSRASAVLNFKSRYFKQLVKESLEDEYVAPDMQKEVLKAFALLDYAKVDYNIIGGELHISLRTTENKYLLESIVDVVTSIYKKMN